MRVLHLQWQDNRYVDVLNRVLETHLTLCAGSTLLYPVLGFGENEIEVTTNFGQDFLFEGLDNRSWRKYKE
jgi:hypothetical protein